MKTVISNGNGIDTVVALEEGNLISGSVSHVSHAIAENAKARHNEGMHGSSDMKHAARVDPVIIEKYLNMNGITLNEFCSSQEHMRRFLVDPAISHFRIWKGRV